MKFSELSALADRMSTEERDETIRQLALDARFAAVVALVRSEREGYVVAGSQQKLATHHGCLAHNGGSVFALDCLQGALRGICEAMPKRRRQEVVED